ncbi:MAG: S1 RNA-binding domain-containing protein [Myxococcales bacterium]|nr:S1 RNA-binding domain-containing protein [Myxococcales bacterium]
MTNEHDPGDFASFMRDGEGPALTALSAGQQVSGTITQISGDSVFVDLGTRAEGRIPRVQLELRDGSVPVSVGDRIEATVVDPGGGDGPLLAVKLGKDQRVDMSALRLALASETPVIATVARAVKGGLELELSGVRAFCPASQVERGYVADLTGFVGREVTVIVTEVREQDRSVVVSRRRALAAEQAQKAQAARERLAVGQEVSGTVVSIQRYGAFVDLGGVEGLVHISELSASHVDKVEDVVSVGEEVQVRVLAIDDAGGAGQGKGEGAGREGNGTDKGPRIRLSMKALQQAEVSESPAKDEVLTGTVVRLLPHGLVVATPKGEGLVPKRELSLSPGADHRRAYQVDQTLEVVVLDGQPGRLRFSMMRVEDVRAGQAYREYREHAPNSGGGLGSMAALLAGIDRQGLPTGPKQPPKVRPAEPPRSVAPSAPSAPSAPTAPTALTEHAASRSQEASSPRSEHRSDSHMPAPPRPPESVPESQADAPPAVKRRRRIVSSASQPGRPKKR